jgi:hypothetical protein
VPRDSASLPTAAVDEVFVFSPTSTYGADPAPNVTEIAYDEIAEFVTTERWSLPPAVENWFSRALDGIVATAA